jgi:hypothetical protein
VGSRLAFQITKGASDKVYQFLAHGRWFSPVIPASTTTKADRHDIAEILLKVALNKINQPIFIAKKTCVSQQYLAHQTF